MAESNRDELADALARLAGGEIAPSEQLPPSSLKQMRDAIPSIRPAQTPDMEMPEAEPVESEELAPEDDDWVMTPVPQEERAHPPAKTAAYANRKPTARAALYQTLKFRQTIIPILLTCGVLTLIFASLKFIMGPESLFSDLPAWVSAALFGAGVLLLLLAAVNMLAVKHSLERP